MLLLLGARGARGAAAEGRAETEEVPLFLFVLIMRRVSSDPFLEAGVKEKVKKKGGEKALLRREEATPVPNADEAKRRSAARFCFLPSTPISSEEKN